jgi:hypothetical protein
MESSVVLWQFAMRHLADGLPYDQELGFRFGQVFGLVGQRYFRYSSSFNQKIETEFKSDVGLG